MNEWNSIIGLSDCKVHDKIFFYYHYSIYCLLQGISQRESSLLTLQICLQVTLAAHFMNVSCAAGVNEKDLIEHRW
jgi:hypothetical protein